MNRPGVGSSWLAIVERLRMKSLDQSSGLSPPGRR